MGFSSAMRFLSHRILPKISRKDKNPRGVGPRGSGLVELLSMRRLEALRYVESPIVLRLVAPSMGTPRTSACSFASLAGSTLFLSGSSTPVGVGRHMGAQSILEIEQTENSALIILAESERPFDAKVQVERVGTLRRKQVGAENIRQSGRWNVIRDVKMRGCVVSRAVRAIHRVLREYDGKIQTGPLQLPQQPVPQFVGKCVAWLPCDSCYPEQRRVTRELRVCSDRNPSFGFSPQQKICVCASTTGERLL